MSPVTPSDIGWSSYRDFEGPFFLGRVRYRLPIDPLEEDKLMATVTAAEGGHYDAINCYDAGIVSVGLIQWIEAGSHGVSNLLGHVAEACGLEAVLGPLKPALENSGATFKKNQAGAWRFFDSAGEIKTDVDSRRLFLKGRGKKGTWGLPNDEARLYARTWAAALANVWASPAACDAQARFTAPRLKNFLLPKARESLYDEVGNEGWPGAIRAAVVSFAVNLPSVTASQFLSFVTNTTSTKWSSDWCIGLLKQLVFGSGIDIWPARYNAIRPVLESLFGVVLPRDSTSLLTWKPSNSMVSSEVLVVSDSKIPLASEPSVPGESPGQKLIRILKRYVGCSLTTRRADLADLVSRKVDKPEAVVGIATNCATSALGVMAKGGVKHPLLNKPYVNGMAIAWVRQIGIDLGALVKYDPKGPQPKPGSLLRYNTPGTNNDHVEWLLGPIGPGGVAEHGGGGRGNNAITSGTGDVRTSLGRPLLEWWDPDKLGIDVVALEQSEKAESSPPGDAQPSNVPEPPAPVVPVPPAPIEPVNSNSTWQVIINFFLMLLKFITGGKK